jgi:hypothetical protein
MFTNCSELLLQNEAQFYGGVAVTDIDHDGAFEVFVAGFGAANRVLKWAEAGFIDIVDDRLADADRLTVSAAAADLDGDGREEIYILNIDTFQGRRQFGDRLLDWQTDHWVDLFSLPQNFDAQTRNSGRSVIAVDRFASGRYGFFVANYGGPMRLYELNMHGMLADVAAAAGLNLVTGGRGAVALPLVSDRMDIFAANENSTNALFRNRDDGTFDNIAPLVGLTDPNEHGRGVAVLDLNQDGRFDLVYGNWEGPHRMFVQEPDGQFRNVAPPHLAIPSRVRTVIAADFDNDGYEELFFNNIGEPNRLFGWREGNWLELDAGDASEPTGLGTGAAVGDWNNDGHLELLITHGETAPQPLSLYHSLPTNYGWLRVLPLTRQGAPARGAVVKLVSGDRQQIRVIDSGSGYLCQMEPVAHFGLGNLDHIDRVEVRWLNGTQLILNQPKPNQLLRVPYPETRR